jgi:hypothetical protein
MTTPLARSLKSPSLLPKEKKIKKQDVDCRQGLPNTLEGRKTSEYLPRHAKVSLDRATAKSAKRDSIYFPRQQKENLLQGDLEKQKEIPTRGIEPRPPRT